VSATPDQHERLARCARNAIGAPETRHITILAPGMTSTAWQASRGHGGWVARVPLPDSGRRVTYRAEAHIGAILAMAGHPVATWTTVEVEGVPISVGPYRPGVPVDPVQPWSEEFTAAVAHTLVTLHGLDCSDWGPLRDEDDRLVGISRDQSAAVIDRWCHAAMWPFDGSDLHAHPLTRFAPELVEAVAAASESIVVAARDRRGVVHSDLHPQHLLVGAKGELAGVLDFGAAFIASRAWDFALLIHYYGLATAAGVARHYAALGSVGAISFDADGTLWDFDAVLRHALGVVLSQLRRRWPGPDTTALTIDRMIAIRDSVAARSNMVGRRLEEVGREAFTTTLADIDGAELEAADELTELYLHHRFEDIEFRRCLPLPR